MTETLDSASPHELLLQRMYEVLVSIGIRYPREIGDLFDEVERVLDDVEMAGLATSADVPLKKASPCACSPDWPCSAHDPYERLGG